MVHVRRRARGPPVTLVVELHGTRHAPAGEDGPAAAPAAAAGARPRPELETEVEVAGSGAVRGDARDDGGVPRARALFEGAGGSEATRLMTRLRVGAAGSRLRITGRGRGGNEIGDVFLPGGA